MARSFVKKARQAIDNEDVDTAREMTRKAVSALDKAAEKDIIHKNNASRRKSRLMLRLNKLEQETE